MRVTFIVFAIFVFSVLIASDKSQINQRYIESAKSVKPSVIFIETYAENSSLYNRTGYGTGTIFTKSGYIVTNYHVVQDAVSFKAKLYDGTVCNFKKITNTSYFLADEDTDLAVMQLDCPGSQSLKPIPIAKEKPSEGEWVIAVGNPYGLSNSITSGIVSSINRSDVGFTDIEDFIQTDVPINPGNSGGPLVNLDGEMIGINTAIRTVSGGYQGISFSIPSDIVVKVFNDLRNYGRVRRGWIGILVKEEITPGKNTKKVTIVSTLQNSPAAIIGLREGDIIIKADSIRVSSKSMLLKTVKNKEIGKRLTLTVKRNQNIKSFSFTMREKFNYLQVNNVLNSLYQFYGIRLDLNAETDNIIISDLSPWKMHTHSNRLKQGDIVIELNNRQISSVDEFATIFKQEKYTLHSLKIIRDGVKILITINTNVVSHNNFISLKKNN
jgi:serine protease Do